ncbi:MAG: hypothetical protein V1718_00655, partial [archaeon]
MNKIGAALLLPLVLLVASLPNKKTSKRSTQKPTNKKNHISRHITKNIAIILITVISALLAGNVQIPDAYATDVFACGNLNIANTVYTLTNNVSSTATCFTIGANNITLDGTGYWINYSNTSTGYAIDNTGGYDNITIKNLKIVQGSTSIDSYAIYFNSGANNGTITNNSITTSGQYSDSIWLQTSSNFNTISNNTITTSAQDGDVIFLSSSSSSNTISGNNITASGTDTWGIHVYSSSSSNT